MESGKTGRRWEADRTKIFSLDRCFKCLNVLHLGEKTLCTVTVTGRRVPVPGPSQTGGAGREDGL